MLPLTWALDANEISECPLLEERAIPSSIQDGIRVSDIKVIMALGDSATAGFGAKTTTFLDTQFLQEYRGLSFAMGGDPGAPTLANFVKHYRPELVGASRGTHLIELCWHGEFCAPDELAYRPLLDQLNAAQSGATSQTLGMELRYLKRQMAIKGIAHEEWKLLTLFIGSNEICRKSCEPFANPKNQASLFEKRLVKTLREISKMMPRTIVNVMQLADLSQVDKFSRAHVRCLPVRPFLSAICPCAINHGERGRWAMRAASFEYNQRIIRLVKRFNLHQKRKGPHWTVAALASPLLRDTDLAVDIPAHFASRLDCFHPSATAHGSMAKALWRDIHQRYEKRTSHLFEQPLVYCPSNKDKIQID